MTIENKPLIRDPEGEVILRDLMVKNSYRMVKSVRTARMLRLDVEAENAAEAEQITKKMCDELRIYNPLVSRCTVEAAGREP